MRRILTSALLLFVLIGGCGSPDDRQGNGADTTAANATTADTTAAGGAAPDTATGTEPSGELGMSVESIVARASERDESTGELALLDELNEPVRVSIDTQLNRHVPDQTDTLRTLHYDGVSLTIYEVTDGKELLQTLNVTDPDVDTPADVEIGMTRNEVHGAVDVPDQLQNNAYVYAQGGPMPTRLYVYFENDVVSRLEWHFPID